MKLKASIIIPTYNHGKTLNYSVASALNQTVKDIEVIIIGDGATKEGCEVADKFTKKDKRVKFYQFPKGPRHGEIYRNKILKSLNSQIICYLSDDDLYLPNHIEQQLKLLENADFSNTNPIIIEPSGNIYVINVDLKIPYFRNLLLTGENRIPLSCAAHSVKFYRKLPYGWRTTPKNIPTDLYMFQQFLCQKKCQLASGVTTTVLHFPSTQRESWTENKRLAEIHKWSTKLKQSNFSEQLQQTVYEFNVMNREKLDLAVRDLKEDIIKIESRAIKLDGANLELKQLKQTATWKLRDKVKSLPLTDASWNVVKKKLK